MLLEILPQPLHIPAVPHAVPAPAMATPQSPSPDNSIPPGVTRGQPGYRLVQNLAASLQCKQALCQTGVSFPELHCVSQM